MRLPLNIAAAITSMALAASAMAGPAEDLIASNKCNKCHTAKSTKKGPSFAAIAEKYKGQADASAKLIELLKTGGTDNHDKVVASEADLKAIAALVLSAK
jgi:cytochrome c